MTGSRWIDRPEDLAAAVERWLAADEVCLDTEFVFERTYRPRLGLIQVAADDEIALVDPLAAGDLETLAPLLAATSTRKVLHAGAGDVAILRRATRVPPRPLLDTQIAAAFAGLGTNLSYAALVRELAGVELPKHETRTDWLRRPLSPEQLRYAAEDVVHLPGVARELERRLVELGRMAWALEDSATLAEEDFVTDPEEAWRRVKGIDRLPPFARRVARELAAWREREAERRDLARPFLLRDETLLALAQRKTEPTMGEVSKLPGFEARRHAAFAGEWIAALSAAREAAEAGASADPPRPRSPLDRERRELLERAVADLVARRAIELGLPPELLLSRRQRGRLYAAWDGTAPLAAPLTGFRRELLGADLDETATAQLASGGA
ncbi:MAG: hypothetical protein AMXMBFR36_11870 [Acidobacteriota bacterium]